MDLGSEASLQEQQVWVPAGPVTVEGNLSIPAGARGIVLFAHGSGSSRHSPRNRLVAQSLQNAGLATLLIDLLTADEEMEDTASARLRFDIGLLAERLVAATDWLARDDRTSDLRVGYFGASTGAGGALVAAAERPTQVSAVVSRGGRPDLAGTALKDVQAPTLLIVGGRDYPVIDMNRDAFQQLGTRVKEVVIVPGATHLFGETGALEEVARLASAWFTRHVSRTPHPPLNAGETQLL
jgi:dienelactone hydrolase